MRGLLDEKKRRNGFAIPPLYRESWAHYEFEYPAKYYYRPLPKILLPALGLGELGISQKFATSLTS
jgi:hypothetical protein